jgi:hypothetical protein
MSKDRILVIVALLCFSPVAAQAESVTGSVWSISVLGLKGESLGTITLGLTDESARTCMSGEWKRARLISSSFQSPAKQFETGDYFPTYETKGQILTIQMNPPGLCDAYLFLKGKFTEHEGKGDYVALGLGGATPLGTFTAKKR